MTHPDTKPEALRLADEIAPAPFATMYELRTQAAAELRRLHAECESLRTQLAEANQPTTEDIEYAKAQGWDVDGATAWHLIWRHADGWAGTRLMMEAWRDAALAKAIAERDAARAEAEALRADAQRYRACRQTFAPRPNERRSWSAWSLTSHSGQIGFSGPEGMDAEADRLRAAMEEGE